MSTKATPNTQSEHFLDSVEIDANEFGGDDFEVVESTPEERGDVIVDDDNDELTVDLDDGEDDAAETTESEEGDDDADDSDSDDDADDSDEGDHESDNEDNDADDDDPEALEDEPQRKEMPKKVPRQRLNKEIERRKAAEAELRELKAGNNNQAEKPEPQQQRAAMAKADPEKFKSMQDAMLDGDTEKAMEIFGELQQAVFEQAVDAASEVAEERISQRETNKLLATASNDIRASFPELDRSADEYDADIEADVVKTRDFYMFERKMAPDVALRRAAKEVAQDYALEDRNVQEEKPEPKRGKVKERKTNLDKKIELAEKERGKLPGSGKNNKEPLPDINKLTDEQFEKLSPEAKAKMRGDII